MNAGNKNAAIEISLALPDDAKTRTALLKILPDAGGAIGAFAIDNIPVFKPVALPLDNGAWPAGGMPFCFPFAGRVWHDGKVGKYQPAGASPGNAVCEMPIHGFNAGTKWKVTGTKADTVTLETSDSEATRAIYPWKFHCRLKYAVRATGAGSVTLEVKVTIRCDALLPEAEGRSMPVAPGFHPYFAARHPGEKSEGFFSFAYDEAVFPALETVQVTSEGNAGARKLASDLFGDAAKSSKAGISIPLHQESLHNLIFSGLSGREARIGKISLAWSKNSPWQNLVCWAKPAAHFFCLEPWHALPDAVNRPRGTAELAPGDSIQFDLSVTVSL